MPSFIERIRHLGLGVQIFLATVGVSLVGLLTAVLVIRYRVDSALHTYWGGGMGPGQGQGQGQGAGQGLGQGAGSGSGMHGAENAVAGRLGQAEEALLSAVDSTLFIATIGAIIAAALVAWIISRYIARPITTLTSRANQIARGKLEGVYVTPDGPRELVELAESFNDMVDSLAHAEVLRSRLVTDVAHELRNPLAAARAQVEGMADGIIPATSENISSVEEDLKHLGNLIADLQELSLAEAGKLKYSFMPTSLNQVVQTVARQQRPLVQEGVVLDVIEDPNLPSINGDEGRLVQVVTNLVSNARRHTTQGSIVLSTSQLPADTASNVPARLVVMVSDTGSGIPAQDLPNIFERFYRSDQSRSAQSGGIGVGLTISRHIVEAHGGRMMLESEWGKGTQAGFWIPLMQ